MKDISAFACRSSLTIAVCGALFLSTGLPQARAVCQQGCDIVNANTFLGDNRSANWQRQHRRRRPTLFSTSGIGNTARFFCAPKQHHRVLQYGQR